MKPIQFCILLFCILLLVTLVRGAQAGSLTPNQLSVAGEQGQVIPRMVALRLDQAVTNLQVIPLDLETGDGLKVLPAQVVQVQVPAGPYDAGQVLVLNLSIDLRQAASGRYVGTLLLLADGEELPLPVSVQVRDPSWIAMIALLAGVIVGFGFSFYRERGQSRDQALVRAGRLRSQMRADTELAAEMKTRIEGCLSDLEMALQGEKYDQAEGAICQAEGWWGRWRRWRTDWLAQLAYREELKRAMGANSVTPGAPVVVRLRRAVEDVVQVDANLESPVILRQKLEEIGDRWRAYAGLNQLLWQAEALLMMSDAKVADLRDRVDRMEGDEATLRKEIRVEIERLEKEGAQMPSYSIGVKGVNVPTWDCLGNAPAVQAAEEAQVRRAGRALTAFRWIGYALAVLFLAGAGFVELYAGNAVFGANAWGDYLGLVLWGFGAEASRSAVMETVKGLRGVR